MVSGLIYFTVFGLYLLVYAGFRQRRRLTPWVVHVVLGFLVLLNLYDPVRHGVTGMTLGDTMLGVAALAGSCLAWHCWLKAGQPGNGPTPRIP
jgi:hypothetical protein